MGYLIYRLEATAEGDEWKVVDAIAQRKEDIITKEGLRQLLEGVMLYYARANPTTWLGAKMCIVHRGTNTNFSGVWDGEYLRPLPQQ